MKKNKDRIFAARILMLVIAVFAGIFVWIDRGWSKRTAEWVEDHKEISVFIPSGSETYHEKVKFRESLEPWDSDLGIDLRNLDSFMSTVYATRDPEIYAFIGDFETIYAIKISEGDKHGKVFAYFIDRSYEPPVADGLSFTKTEWVKKTTEGGEIWSQKREYSIKKDFLHYVLMLLGTTILFVIYGSGLFVIIIILLIFKWAFEGIRMAIFKPKTVG